MSAIAVDPNDSRFQVGAYISDGVDLYEVVDTVSVPQFMSAPNRRIVVENCRNEARLQFELPKIADSFELVRAAPNVPDLIPEGA